MENAEYRPLVLGLTGQTGAGKTTVSDMLRGRGYRIIDCDKLAREVVMDPECLADLTMAFGVDILNEDGKLNRRRLAMIAFNRSSELKKLNDIVHPRIIEQIKVNLENAAKRQEKIVVIDAPQLFESGVNTLCDRTIVVVADDATRYDRIIKRDNLTEREAKSRMNAQHPVEYYTNRTKNVLRNNGDVYALRIELMKMLEHLEVVKVKPLKREII